jgi:hypothetical protein
MLGDKIDKGQDGAPHGVEAWIWRETITVKDEDVSNISPIGSRETVAESFENRSAEQQSWLVLLMENPSSDDLLLSGLHLYLDQASEGRFLNSETGKIWWMARQCSAGAASNPHCGSGEIQPAPSLSGVQEGS